MKRAFTIIYILFCLAVLVYAFPRSPGFPNPPTDSPQSTEPADTETDLRRAYFTDYTRADVVSHYKEQFAWFPFVRLNYPPEEAQTLIRDQTRSSYLEELVHPLRESLYISGFVPSAQKDTIIIGGKTYYEKLTVRYVASGRKIRYAYLAAALGTGYFVFIELGGLLSETMAFLKNGIKRWKK